jgi:hypothetical protein
MDPDPVCEMRSLIREICVSGAFGVLVLLSSYISSPSGKCCRLRPPHPGSFLLFLKLIYLASEFVTIGRYVEYMYVGIVSGSVVVSVS